MAKKAFRLQHLGPPCCAIVRRLLAVIRLLSFHSCIDNGVELVIKLMKMPVPTAAPQFPWNPQNPPKMFEALKSNIYGIDLSDVKPIASVAPYKTNKSISKLVFVTLDFELLRFKKSIERISDIPCSDPLYASHHL